MIPRFPAQKMEECAAIRKSRKTGGTYLMLTTHY